MQKYKLSKIGYNLIIISGGILLITYFSKYKYDWIYYIAGIFSILGIILAFLGKTKKKE